MTNDLLNFGMDPYHTPAYCSKCNGVMVFKGVGEYQCEDCKNIEYDDFGKVRLYIEAHKGATAVQIEEGTGVKQKTIRLMLKEQRLEIAADSHAFLQCELCGISIRAGRFCPKCEKTFHERREAMNRKQKNMSGYGKRENTNASGAKRLNGIKMTNQ